MYVCYLRWWMPKSLLIPIVRGILQCIIGWVFKRNCLYLCSRGMNANYNLKYHGLHVYIDTVLNKIGKNSQKHIPPKKGLGCDQVRSVKHAQQVNSFSYSGST